VSEDGPVTAKLKRFARNASIALAMPDIALEYGSWILQRLMRGEPIREIHGIKLGGFNGFSEFHSVSSGLSAAESALLRTFQFSRGAILDVGANLGLFALAAASVVPSHRVFAFEPGPSTFEALKRNIARNAAEMVECHQLAITDQEGKSRFEMKENARANSCLSFGSPAEGTSSIEVRCTTLDRFVATHGIKEIALLKVDVEGYEFSVFRGAKEVLSRIRPRMVYFEVCPPLAEKAGFEPVQAAADLIGHGYLLHRVSQRGHLQEAGLKDIRDVVVENWAAIDRR
jgi:FkbM family methyltransferase